MSLHVSHPPLRNERFSILVVRRDNIGDLVCTTPLLVELRKRFPLARIEVLVNSYNAAVLRQHPAVDAVHVYTKLKHRTTGQSRWKILLRRLLQVYRLRRRRFDYAIVAGRGGVARTVRTARRLRARRVIAFTDADGRALKGVDLPVALANHGRHEVEDTFDLLRPLGIVGQPPPVRIMVPPVEEELLEAWWNQQGWPIDRARIAVHISARKASNRWPAEKFVALIRKIHASEGAGVVLLWSPGAHDNPLHPGDDQSAHTILGQLKDLPVLAYPTRRLEQLIACIASCDRIVCSDGGAMHIAAALGKPILCLFGDSDATRWHPWGVSHVLLQPPSREVSAIGVDEVFGGFKRLLECSHARPARQ